MGGNIYFELGDCFVYVEINVLWVVMSILLEFLNYVLIFIVELCLMCVVVSVFSGVRVIIFGILIEIFI